MMEALPFELLHHCGGLFTPWYFCVTFTSSIAAFSPTVAPIRGTASAIPQPRIRSRHSVSNSLYSPESLVSSLSISMACCKKVYTDEICGRREAHEMSALDRLRRANAPDSNVVVMKELELMHEVERVSCLKSLLNSDDQRLADACIDACHVALRYCTREQWMSLLMIRSLEWQSLCSNEK